jgi:hypothetical protein
MISCTTWHFLCADEDVQLQTPTSDPYPHVTQSYADDFVGVAVSGVSLQRLINGVHAHSNRCQLAMGCQCHRATSSSSIRSPMCQRMRWPVALQRPHICYRLLVHGCWGRLVLPVRRSVSTWASNSMVTVHGRFKPRKPGPKGAEPCIPCAGNWRPIFELPHMHVDAYASNCLCQPGGPPLLSAPGCDLRHGYISLACASSAGAR